LLNKAVPLFQLGQAEGGLEVGHAVIPAEFFMDKTPLGLKAQVAEAAAALGEGFIVGHKHAAFAGGDKLVGVKTEDAQVTKGAAGFAFVCLAVGFGSVFNDF
jgi:hypothetical protein